jgi:hypothetical protein
MGDLLGNIQEEERSIVEGSQNGSVMFTMLVE